MLSDRDYRAVFEASPDAVLIVDANGVIRDVNPRAQAMFGWSRQEMEGSRVERLIPAASRGRRINALGIGAKVLVLTMHDEDEFLVPALNAGAAGFLNKSVESYLARAKTKHATRGSGWNADHIRSTWLQNLTN